MVGGKHCRIESKVCCPLQLTIAFVHEVYSCSVLLLVVVVFFLTDSIS